MALAVNDAGTLAPGYVRPWPRNPRYVATEEGGVLDTERDRWLRQYRGKGYLQVQIRALSGEVAGPVPVHKIVLEAWSGLRPSPRHVCRHLDGNPRNNRRSNLAWGTHSENMADAIRHGRRSKCLPDAKLLIGHVWSVRR